MALVYALGAKATLINVLIGRYGTLINFGHRAVKEWPLDVLKVLADSLGNIRIQVLYIMVYGLNIVFHAQRLI